MNIKKGKESIELKVVTVFFLVFSFCSLVLSKSIDYSKEYESCISKNPQISNMVIHSCAERVSEAVNVEIKAALKSLKGSYSKDALADIDKLNASQELWIKYRDAQCELAGTHIGSPMLSLCPMQKNIQRLKELNDLLQQ